MDQGSQWPQPGPQGGPPGYPPGPPAGGPPPGGPPPGGPPSSGGWQAAEPAQPKGTPGWLVPALVAIIVLAIGGIAYFVIFDDDEDTSAEPSGDETDEPTTPQDPDDPDDTPTEPDVDAERLTGTWEGTYECSAGVTGLTLTIDDFPGEDAVGAAFHLHPTDDNPDRPDALFHMEGTYTDGILALEGVLWEDDEQPDDISDWVDLEADLTDRTDTEIIEGDILGDGCEGFSVQRTSTEPWYVGAWQGHYYCSQGITLGTIIIESAGQDRVEGWFQFEEHEESTQPIPTGSYYVTGWYQDRSLRLSEAGWVEQPPNYMSVDWVTVEIPTHPDVMFGQLDADSCQVFLLHRIDVEDLPYDNPMDDFAEESEAEPEPDAGF